MKLRHQVDRIEHAEALDPAVAKVSAVAGRLYPSSPRLRNLLHGSWLGHPAHPMLTDVPIGLWTATILLDLVGGKAGRPAARRLLGLGLLAAVPTAVTGMAEWESLGQAKEERRTGVVHALANSAGSTFLALSYAARHTGRHRGGTLLGLIGYGATMAGAYLGGHLTYRQGVGVDHGVFDEPAEGWTAVADVADLAEGIPAAARAGEMRVVLVRRGQDVLAISATCAHLGGPLDEGDVVMRDGRACIECPWHGSVFDLADGHVVEAPASAPQLPFDVRVRGGSVEVRPRPLPTADEVIDLTADDSTSAGHA